MNPNLSEPIQVMVACGLTPRAIAKELGLSESLLIEEYRADLEHGLEMANAKVAKTFFDLATSGDHPTLTKAWMELRGGWSSSSTLNLTDPQEEAELAREKLLKLLNRSSSSAKVTPFPTKTHAK